uniref:Zinc finger and BTB domain containing 3 n=1 Tax=Gouania willdenowi TaxID=441366 RepID=A0A8C5G4Z0_GOUWI
MDFPDHSQQLLSALRSQRQRGFLCDCTVLVGSARFQAHRAVLASCSPFFNMFYSDSAEGNSTSSCVTLDGDIVTSAAFGLLLDFVYEGVLHLEGSSPVEDILAAASFLHMNGVVRVCKRRIHKRGPLAEADSTRCEQNTALKTAREQRQEDGAQPSVELNQTLTQTQLSAVLRATDRTQSKERPARCSAGGFIKALSPELADTTQPGMDGPPTKAAHGTIRDQAVSFTGAPRLEAEEQKEPSSLCSPCSTTGPNRYKISTVLLDCSADNSLVNAAFYISSAVRGRRQLCQPLHLLSCFGEVLGEEVKAEAIVISDEELDDEKLPVMEVDEDFADTQEEATSPHVLSSNPLGLLHIVSLTNDYTFPLSPPSSSSPGAPPSSSQDALHSPSTSDTAPFIQSIHDSMGNFIKDVPTCGVCGKTFVCSYTLRRHAIVHTRARPYVCRYCHRTYTQSGDLYRHVRKSHDHTLPARRSKADIEASALQPAPPDTS